MIATRQVSHDAIGWMMINQMTGQTTINSSEGQYLGHDRASSQMAAAFCSSGLAKVSVSSGSVTNNTDAPLSVLVRSRVMAIINPLQ